MNEARVLALAGVFQAIALVGTLAREGECDQDALAASIASVFKLESDDATQVFGGQLGVHLGLRKLIEYLDADRPDMEPTRLLIGTLGLERSLARHSDCNQRLGEGLAGMQRQLRHFPPTHPTILARLADLYEENLSSLKPRLIVRGNPLYLQRSAHTARIRAVLLAGVRAAVLWHQLGGRRRHLWLRPKRELMIARGMLTGVALRG